MSITKTNFLDTRSLESIRTNLVSHVKICAFIGEIDNGIPQNILINNSQKLIKIPCLLCESVKEDIRTNDLVSLCGRFLLRGIDENSTELCFHIQKCRGVITPFSDPVKFFQDFSHMKKKMKIENLTKRLRSRTPTTYYRVAIITFGIEENGTIIEDFQSVFQEKCTGKLYTYRANPTDFNKTIIAGIGLFRNYYDIDLIIIFPTDSTIETAMMLSSREIVSHLYYQQKNHHKKPFPYLIGLDTPDARQTTSTFHIYRELCNAVFTVPNCIEFIQNSQIKFKENVETCIEWGLFHVDKEVGKLKDILLDLELRFVNMDFDSVNRKPNDYDNNTDLFTKTQYLLHTRLTESVDILDKILFDMMSHVLDDPHIQELLSASME